MKRMILLCSIVVLPAFGQTFKCSDAGAVRYQGQPCVGGEIVIVEPIQNGAGGKGLSDEGKAYLSEIEEQKREAQRLATRHRKVLAIEAMAEHCARSR